MTDQEEVWQDFYDEALTAGMDEEEATDYATDKLKQWQEGEIQ